MSVHSDNKYLNAETEKVRLKRAFYLNAVANDPNEKKTSLYKCVDAKIVTSNIVNIIEKPVVKQGRTQNFH